MGGSGTGSGGGSGSGSGTGVGSGSGPGSSGGSEGGTGSAVAGHNESAASSGGLVRPAAKSLDKPVYPEECRRGGQEGTVTLRVLVRRDGTVGEVQVAAASGVKAFDRAASRAAKRWRFEPARRGDQPVEAWMKIPVIFRLED